MKKTIFTIFAAALLSSCYEWKVYKVAGEMNVCNIRVIK